MPGSNKIRSNHEILRINELVNTELLRALGLDLIQQTGRTVSLCSAEALGTDYEPSWYLFWLLDYQTKVMLEIENQQVGAQVILAIIQAEIYENLIIGLLADPGIVDLVLKGQERLIKMVNYPND